MMIQHDDDVVVVVVVVVRTLEGSQIVEEE
jgi:hypothetical protein